jgi:hypothetical protein
MAVAGQLYHSYWLSEIPLGIIFFTDGIKTLCFVQRYFAQSLKSYYQLNLTTPT